MDEGTGRDRAPARYTLDDRQVEEIEYDAATTSAADVESAGRSCLAILVMVVVIVALLVIWLVYRSMAGSS